MVRGLWLRAWARALTLTLIAAVVAVVGVVVVPSTVGSSSRAEAAVSWPEYTIDMSKWDAGRIINDELFFDPNSMTVAEIQTFLNEKVPDCRNGYTCLKDKFDITNNIPANPMCTAYTRSDNPTRTSWTYKDSAGVHEKAALIIYKVGRACGISPKVILVTLEKEQGLVTDDWPGTRQYKYAMGADCPDSGDGCGLTAGFFKQVYRGVYMMKRYTQPAGTGPGTNYESDFAAMHRVHTWVNVRYGISTSCGTKRTYIANQATHVLYVYTPYTPNAGALAAGWGTAPCGAYGNRNFFRYYFKWFGDPHGIPPAMTDPPTQTGTEVGLEKVGTVLTASKGAWKGVPTPAPSYQWFKCDAPVDALKTAAPTGCAAIPNATAATYTLTVNEVGKFVAPRIKVSNVAGTTYRLTATTAKVYLAPANTVLPAISGTVRPAQTLTVSNGTWTGLPAPTFTYQWSVCNAEVPQPPVVTPVAVRSSATRPAPVVPPAPTCTAIEGATKSTFVARVADIGKYYQAKVTAKNTSATTVVTSTSMQVQSVPLVVKHAALGGRAKIGATVSAAVGSYTAVPAATMSYQFFSCPAAIKTTVTSIPNTCVSLGNASSTPSVAVPAAAKGKFVTAKVIATNAIGSTVEYTPSSAAVADDPLVPLITGAPSVGHAVTASSGTWTGTTTRIRLATGGRLYGGYSILGVQQALRADGYATPLTGVYDSRTISDVRKFQLRHHVPNPDGYVGEMTWKAMRALTVSTTPSFTYQWMRCASAVTVTPAVAPTAAPFSCVSIAAATDASYTPVAADRNKFLVVAVTASGVQETPKVRWSLSTVVVP